MVCYGRKVFAIFLTMVMLCTMMLPALAANESNTLGVTFSATLNQAVLEKSESNQTVVMTIRANQEIDMDSLQIQVSVPQGLSVASVVAGDSRFSFNVNNGKATWYSAGGDNLAGVTDLATITVNVPANTPAGTYQVGVGELKLSKDYGTNWEKTATAYTTLTITDSTPATGYSAAVSCGVSEVTVGDELTVYVGVSHDSKTAFAASELVLSYDAAMLTFNQTASTLNGASVKNANGTLTIENYGADKNCGTGVYALKFSAAADGTASVTLTSAAFSDKASAAKEDLTAAAIGNDSVSITVNKQSFAVTLPDIFTGASSVTDGDSYTFTATDSANYTYAAPTATVGGVAAGVTNNGDGTYTVANVTGALVISGSRTPKSYTVTFAGNAASDVTGAAATATYGTDYSFTMPSAAGWAYSLGSITVGGTAYTGYSVSSGVHTIPGADIKGNVVITVNKSQTTASVTVEGSGAGAAAGFSASANIGNAYSLTITPVAGYSYTVTAVMGGSEAALTNSGNTYTIANVTGNIVFTVEQSVVTDGVSVSKYLTLNGTNMWLVKNDVTLASGSVATYDGAPMLEKDGVYCTLVIADTLTSETAAAKVGIASGTAAVVENSMDVNMSGKVDANDAQLTYNMYNAEYSAFTSDVTVEKFLRADVNGDGVVNVSDAAAIISAILG